MRNKVSVLRALLVSCWITCAGILATGLNQSLWAQTADAGLPFRTIASIDDQKVLDQYQLPDQVADTFQARQIYQELIVQLRSDGYPLASVDSLLLGDAVSGYLYIGQRYRWRELSPGNLDPSVQRKVGIKRKHYFRNQFSYKRINRTLEEVIRYSENNGYPFASVSLDSVSIVDGAIAAAIRYEPGPLITFDSLVITGDHRVKESFLGAYLRIRPGSLFDYQRVRDIPQRIEELPYVELVGLPGTTFQNNSGKVEMELKRRKVNRFDGIIGFLPNESNEGSLLITGEVDLDLFNLFNSGNELHLHWQRLRQESQLLDVQYLHTNLFRLPLDLSAGFNQLKEDTTFINRIGRFDVTFEPKPGSTLKVITTLKASRLLSTSQYEDATTLPDNADFNLNAYGLGYELRRWDNRIFPTRGWSLLIEGTIGNKKLRMNSGLDEALYEGVPLNSIQGQVMADVAYLIPVNRLLSLSHRLRGGYMANERLFLSDLFRVGGLNTLRGFGENFFFASEYFLSNLELRLGLGAGSFLFAFYDQSFLNYNLTNDSFRDHPLGIGLGLSLATGNGLFNFVYALGQSEEQKFNFNRSKIHFGFVSRF